MISLELLSSLLCFHLLIFFSFPVCNILHSVLENPRQFCTFYQLHEACIEREFGNKQKEPRMRHGNLGESYCSCVYRHEKFFFLLHFVCVCHLWSRSFSSTRGAASFFVTGHCCRMAGTNASPWTHDSSQLCLKTTAHSASCLISKGFFVTYKLQHNIMCQLCVS